MTARDRRPRWMAGREGDIERTPPEGTEPDHEDDQDPVQPKLEPAKHPGRLGDRRPEFRELSEQVAEANRRSREGRR